jgi:hypothetical protein
VSSTHGRVGLRLGFFRKFRGSVGFGFFQHRFGLGSGFRLGFGFFQNFNKFMGISRKISMKKKKNEINQFIKFTVWIQYMAGFELRKKVLTDVTRYTK